MVSIVCTRTAISSFHSSIQMNVNSYDCTEISVFYWSFCYHGKLNIMYSAHRKDLFFPLLIIYSEGWWRESHSAHPNTSLVENLIRHLFLIAHFKKCCCSYSFKCQKSNAFYKHHVEDNKGKTSLTQLAEFVFIPPKWNQDETHFSCSNLSCRLPRAMIANLPTVLHPQPRDIQKQMILADLQYS